MTEFRLSIAGIGLAGGFGVGNQALLNAIRKGGGPNGAVSVATPSFRRSLPAYQVDVSSVTRFVLGGALRRVNRFGKMAMLGASLALEDAGLGVPLARNDIGLAVASGYGASESTFNFLDTMIDNDGSCPSPTLFSNSVHSSAASHTSILMQCGGPCLTVSQFEMSPLSALLSAREWLRRGRVEMVVFGAVEEICPVLGYCYDRFFGADAGGAIEPFAWDRQTAVMGEGAAFLVLTRDKDDGKGYGTIDELLWTRTDRDIVAAGGDLVLGADGHTCCARDYSRLSRGAGTRTSYSPLYGSLPSGQAFDVAIAALAARAGLGPDRVRSIKCDAQGNCGMILCRFGRGS